MQFYFKLYPETFSHINIIIQLKYRTTIVVQHHIAFGNGQNRPLTNKS
jgi:hypothetical protein